ncbi:hypothetical protein CHUAL_001340 [Chamberlinius hualienensis]
MWIKLFILLSVACAVMSQSCTRNGDCGRDECCIEYFPYYKRCTDMGDDVGDRCLGQFYCDCKPGLRCELDPPSRYNLFKVGNGYCVTQ